jgi:hypothetical protein
MIAFGEPSWQMNVDGRWDLVPVVVAIVGLVLLRVLFAARITPLLVLVVLLAAPLYRAVADAVGFTRGVSVTLAFVAIAAVAVRRNRHRPRPPLGDV